MGNWRGACQLPSYGGPEIFESTRPDLCNIVHFYVKICSLNNSVFNLDFGRSI